MKMCQAGEENGDKCDALALAKGNYCARHGGGKRCGEEKAL